jgi:hypothetical protein
VKRALRRAIAALAIVYALITWHAHVAGQLKGRADLIAEFETMQRRARR